MFHVIDAIHIHRPESERWEGGREGGRENGPAMNPNIGSSEIASSYGEYAKRAGRDDNFRTKVKSKKDEEEEEEDSALLRVYSILHSLVNMNDFNIP